MNAYIFKYEIPITDEIISIELSENSGLCDINVQDDKIYMWCIVDIHAPIFKQYFKIFGTGHQIIDCENLIFLKTVHMPNGLVWHIFKEVIS